MNKNEAWIKEALEQFKEGNVTAHELIEVEGNEELAPNNPESKEENDRKP